MKNRTVKELAIQPGFLPLAEAAAWAGISTRTLKRWIERGLPKYQAGPRSKILIRPTDIEVFLTKHQMVPTDLERMVKSTLQDLTGLGN